MSSGRYEPQSATGRMLAARRHREKAYAERNEVIMALIRTNGWDAHLMPTQGMLQELDEKLVICAHSPRGPLAWLVTLEEAAKHFKDIPVTECHPYERTHEDRSMQLALLEREGQRKTPKVRKFKR